MGKPAQRLGGFVPTSDSWRRNLGGTQKLFGMINAAQQPRIRRRAAKKYVGWMQLLGIMMMRMH